MARSWEEVLSGERDIKRVLERIRRRCQDIKLQETFAKMRGMTTLDFYCKIKKIWGKEDYVDGVDNRGRAGWAWFRLGLWRSRGIRKNFERVRCLLCYEEEDEVHIMLVGKRTQGWRREYLEDKVLKVNPVVGLKKII